MLSLGYILFVARNFEYAGFEYVFSLSRIVFSLVVFALFLVLMPKCLNKPSDFYVNLLFFLVFLPILLLYCLAGQDGSTFYSVASGLAVILIICSKAPFFMAPKPLKVSFLCLILIVVFVSLASYVVQILLAERLWFNFSLLDVYDYRDTSGELLNIGIMSYLNVWLSKVLIPLLVAVTAWFKKYRLTALFCLLSLLVYGISQHKSVLIYPYIVIALVMLFRNRKGMWILPFSLSVLLICVLLAYDLADNILLPSMMIRRSFFVPALLSYKYHQFFSDNQFVYWSSSFLRPFVSYPYDLSTAKVIGRYLGTNANANINFFATGYMHAGYIGLYIYCATVGLILNLIDSLARNKFLPSFPVAVTIVPMLSLISSADLPTALCTHGLGLALIFLYLLRSSSAVNRISAASSE